MLIKLPKTFVFKRQSISLYSTKEQIDKFSCKIENQELIHYHIKNKYADYTKISDFQTSLLNQYLSWYKKYPIFKLNEMKQTNPEEYKEILKTKPKPSIISAEFNPIFTAGKKFMKTIQNPDGYSKPYRNFIPSSKTMIDKTLVKKEECKLPEFQFINRGGKITYHGPGQLVIYFILDLKDFQNLDIRKYIASLERNLKEYFVDEGLDVVNYRDEVGVFVKRKSNNCTYKISSIGINLQKLVTTHGVSINIQNNLEYLNTFEMCGLENLQQTSLLNEKKTETGYDMSLIARQIVNKINNDLGNMNVVYENISEDEINDRYIYINN